MTNFLKEIKTIIKSLGTAYNKSSLCGKILIFTMFLLLVILMFKGMKNNYKEGFEQNDKFLFKTGPEVYDDFYSDIYDYLVFNDLKDEYEVGEIINKTAPSSKSRILDVGCGTGHHVNRIAESGLDILGIDISPSMIKKAKENFPDRSFEIADALNGNEFERDTFTHILCLYFTIYYIKDKQQFFENCSKWLKPGGYLLVHLVDRERFDPILPPGNPLLYVSPQRYAKERITSTKVKFNDFDYNANFQLDKQSNTAKFVEKFRNETDGKVRKNEHTMYMPDTQEITDEARAAGFIIDAQIDLLQCQYEYQYVYVFRKSI